MSSSMLRSLKLASSILQKQSLRGGSASQLNFIAPTTLQLQLRPISTSKKNRDVTTVAAGGDKKDDKPDPGDFSYEAAKKVSTKARNVKLVLTLLNQHRNGYRLASIGKRRNRT